MQLRQPLNLRKPLQMTAHKIRPTLNLPFAASGSLGPLITYTGQNGTYFNSSGTLTAATTNVARFDYDPSTLIARGLLIEEARTNSIRNNTMVGASAGTPGTMPTNWTTFTALTGLTRQVVGSGTESGISYLDIKVSGTPSGVGTYAITEEGINTVAAVTAQVWDLSRYVRLVAGTLTGVTGLTNRFDEYTAAAAFIKSTSGTVITPTSAALASQRYSDAVTLSGGGTTAFLNPVLVISLSGAAIDITLRIGMPQLELGAFATSVISTSTVAVTRSADLASITGANFTSFWNATQGTIVTQYLFNRTIGSGEFPSIVTANDGTTSNQVAVYAFVSAGNNRSSFISSVAGVTQADLGSGSATFNGASGTAHKLAGAYAANNFAASFDGSATLTDTSGSLPTLDRLTLGAQGNGTQYLNGWISSLQIFPVRLTNTQLQTLST